MEPSTCRPSKLRRLRVEIHGAVQGVGFRPFVYRLADRAGPDRLGDQRHAGRVHRGRGRRARRLRRFLDRLPAETPPRAIVQVLESRLAASRSGYARFEIRHSDSTGAKTALVLPDIATCPDCLAEVLDPADRRYRYPFTNCTNCGPRFSIIEALPYDRPNTTMRRFTMCPTCRAEYENPLDRRFHAQPNACPVCGPRLTLYGRWTKATTADGCCRPQSRRRRGARRRAADALRARPDRRGQGAGRLPPDGATRGNGAAVQRLRERKPRREKPFAVMAPRSGAGAAALRRPACGRGAADLGRSADRAAGDGSAIGIRIRSQESASC